MSSRGISERLREIADQFENDRREPDKVLCAVQNLRRLATDIDIGEDPLGERMQRSAEIERREREEFAETCCGKCPGDTCYVDQALGN